MKKTRARLERGQEGGDVGLALERRAGGLHQRHPQLGGDDVGERGLAEPGRAGEQHVVERLAAAPRGLDEDLELLGHLALVDEVGEASRGRSERSSSSSAAARAAPSAIGLGDRRRRARRRRCSDRAIDVIHSGAASAAAPAVAQRARPIRSSAVSPSAPSSSSLGLGERVAEVDQAVAGERARVARRHGRRRARTSSSSSPATFSRSSTMIRSAVRLPIPGTAWKRLASPAAIARSSSRGAAAGEDRDRDLRADPRDRGQRQEEVALLLAGEAVERRASRRGRRGGRAGSPRSPLAGTAFSVSAETASR